MSVLYEAEGFSRRFVLQKLLFRNSARNSQLDGVYFSQRNYVTSAPCTGRSHTVKHTGYHAVAVAVPRSREPGLSNRALL